MYGVSRPHTWRYSTKQDLLNADEAYPWSPHFTFHNLPSVIRKIVLAVAGYKTERTFDQKRKRRTGSMHLYILGMDRTTLDPGMLS